MSEYNQNCVKSRYSTCPLAQDCFGLVDDSEDCKCRLEDYNKGRTDAERDFQNSDYWNDYLAKVIADAKADALDHCEKCEIEQWDAIYRAEEDTRAKVLDVVSDVLVKMNNICGRSCPVDCEWGTDESCKEQWKKYLIKRLDEQIVKGE